MSLRFPATEDLRLEHSPLTNVLCQVRFPPILSIARGQPVMFQEAIRHRFPEMEVDQNISVRVSMEGAHQGSRNAEVAARGFQFSTPDGSSTATLSPESYSLLTSKYTVWGDFAADLAAIHEAAMATYQLPYGHRIGLRYVNQLDRERTGRTSLADLAAFLRPELVALVRTDAWDQAEQVVSHIVVREGDVHLLIRVVARPQLDDEDGPLVLLDLDCFEEGQLDLSNLIDRCDRYHNLVYRAFRWAIKPDALEAFSPVHEGT